MVAATFQPSKETPIKLSAACKRYGTCRRTGDNWVDRGLDAFRMGGAGPLYTTLEALERFHVYVPRGDSVSPSREQRQIDREAQAAQEFLANK